MSKLLEVRDVTKRFGGLTAVNNLSFHVEAGESLGLIGPNGAGKTTIFNLIMNELQQTSGEIFFNGQEISNEPTHKRVKRGIVRTYQIPRPFHEMPVADNIRVGMMADNLWDMITQPPDLAGEQAIAKRVGRALRPI